jgi:VanZ family protein
VLASGQLEHFGAYCVAGFILGFGYFGRLPLLGIAIGLSIYSGILEIAQLFIPGRGSRLIDFFASSAGAWTGVMLVLLLYPMLGRKIMPKTQ